MSKPEVKDHPLPESVVTEVHSMMVSKSSTPMTAAQIRGHMGLIQDLLKECLVWGTHYGVPNGFPLDTKPFLYDAGAQKIRLMFNIRAEYEIIEKTERDDFIGYIVLARLIDRGTGRIIGEGIGSCNSRERKYRWRKVPSYNAKPGDRERAIHIEKRKGNPDWEMFTIENDPWELQQTFLAMGQVRSSKKATRDALAASDILGIDEDLARDLIQESDYEVQNPGSDARVDERQKELREQARSGAGGSGKSSEKNAPSGESSSPPPPPPPPEPKAPHVALVRNKAIIWQNETKAGRDTFKQMVLLVSEGRTDDYNHITPEEADALVASMDAGIDQAVN